MKKSSLMTSFALIAGMSVGSTAFAQERVIPQSLIDRYSDTLRGPKKSDKKEECRGFRDLISNGNILKRSFANGQGRITIDISRGGGGTIGFAIDIGTAAGLKPQSCSSWIPSFN